MMVWLHGWRVEWNRVMFLRHGIWWWIRGKEAWRVLKVRVWWPGV